MTSLDIGIALELVKFPFAQLVKHSSSISNKHLEKCLLGLEIEVDIDHSLGE
jgi:hypothetical protein